VLVARDPEVAAVQKSALNAALAGRGSAGKVRGRAQTPAQMPPKIRSGFRAGQRMLRVAAAQLTLRNRSSNSTQRLVHGLQAARYEDLHRNKLPARCETLAQALPR